MGIKDETMLAKYEEMMRQARIQNYEASLKPMTTKEFHQSISEAEKDVEAGRLIDIEDLQKEMENW
jgi:hypothetical protein